MAGTRTFHAMQRPDGGTTGIDDDFTARGFDGIGAWILGRNMCSDTSRKPLAEAA
jgi:hypothetical protein